MNNTTKLLFRDDSYLTSAIGEVTSFTEDGGIILDQTLFYPVGGGQPCDQGELIFEGIRVGLRDIRKGEGSAVILYPLEGSHNLEIGQKVEQKLDWSIRHGHMRVHSALHLLSVVIPLGVTGGSIGPVKGRLDFEMPDSLADKELVESKINDLIARDLVISESWISEADLDSNPGLVKTLRVQPPRGQGTIRLIRMGTEDEQIDLQPCGGTHVRKTSEIGRVRLGKVENKGKANRRVHLHLED
jgi:misacylated tRNA(Ala) deacylase